MVTVRPGYTATLWLQVLNTWSQGHYGTIQYIPIHMPLYSHFCTSLALLYHIICLIAGSVPPGQKAQVSHDHVPHVSFECSSCLYSLLTAQPSHIVYSTSKINLITSVDAKHHGASLSERWNVTWVGNNSIYTH